MVDFFTWVADLSGWYWLAFGIGLIALEMLVPSFIMVWPGLAAIVVAALVAIAPNLSGELLVALFGGLSIAMTFVGRSIVNRLDKNTPPNTLNARGASMIGQHAKVVAFDAGEGKVIVNGVQWPAAWPDGEIAEVGQSVEISGSGGVQLFVKNL